MKWLRYSIAFLLYPFVPPPWRAQETDQHVKTLEAYRREADAALHDLRIEFTSAWRRHESHGD